MEKLLQFNDVTFQYSEDSRIVLDNVSLTFDRGEFVAVLGHNGCGKSTLAKHANGILIPTKGTVTVDGVPTTDEDHLLEIRQKVGMVFQNPDNQIVATIVEEDVAFGLENIGVEPNEIRKRVDEALKAVDMYDFREHAPHQLSGGQKQRIAIAGAIAMRPECLILDEPTAMLDPKGREEVLKTLRKLNKDYGITVIIITHYMDEAAKCDRVVVMDKGKILLDDVPKKVFSQVETMQSIGLEVPQVTNLIYQLKKAGYTLPQDVISEDECINVLADLLSKEVKA